MGTPPPAHWPEVSSDHWRAYVQTHPPWGTAKKHCFKGLYRKEVHLLTLEHLSSGRWTAGGALSGARGTRKCQWFSDPPLPPWSHRQEHSANASASQPWFLECIPGPRTTPALWLVPRTLHSSFPLQLQLQALSSWSPHGQLLLQLQVQLTYYRNPVHISNKREALKQGCIFQDWVVAVSPTS